MDNQQKLLHLLSEELPSNIPGLQEDQIILGQEDHPRRIEGEYPLAVYNIDQAHIQPKSEIDRAIFPKSYYLAAGEAVFRWDNRYYRLQQGDFLFLPRMVNHYLTYSGPEKPYELVCFNFTQVVRLYIAHGEYILDNKYVMRNLPHLKVPRALLKTIEGITNGQEQGITPVRQKIQGILRVLDQVIRKKGYFFPVIDIDQKTWQQKSVARIESYILEHLTDKLSLEEIAQQLSMSRRSLVSLFRKEFGDSVFEYIVQTRMRMALDLLGTTTLSVSEIAYKLNYEDIYFFSKQFKKCFGISPSDYRNKYL